ncbi:MAG: hypothetical protein M3126_04445 [Candidatus Eremiobacteraeota bacterium]|nr:hypothetical protein [Candidatus Eremiobacteraeota bacterium]
MSEFLKKIGGIVPARVRYCESDGSISSRDTRLNEIQDSIVREMMPLRGFFSGA